MSSGPLSDIVRGDLVRRIADGIFGFGRSSRKYISKHASHTAAVDIESRAYTAAQVAGSITTGVRPAEEVLSFYIRKAAEILVKVVTNHGKPASLGSSSEVYLDLYGSRAFLTRETATELLQRMLAEGSEISQVRLSTKSFGSEAAPVLASAIQNVQLFLTNVDMSDVIASRPEGEALFTIRMISEALGHLHFLRILNLSDNALGEKGIRACEAVLSSAYALESLELNNVGCSIAACLALAQLLVNCEALAHFHLSNNMSDSDGAGHIAKILHRCPVLEDFRMASSRVGFEGGIALAAGLSSGCCLVKLDLSGNPLAPAAAPALAQMISLQPQLTLLNLDDTSLGDVGVSEIAAMLTMHVPLLTNLGLALNEVTPVGALAIATALASKQHLTTLNMRENELGAAGCVLLATAVGHCTKLSTLNFGGNNACRVGAVALVQAAAMLPAMQLLLLEENRICKEGEDEVRAILLECGKSEILGPLDKDAEATGDED